MVIHGNFWHKIIQFGFKNNRTKTKFKGHTSTPGTTRSRLKRFLEKIDPIRNIHNFEI